MDAVKYIKTKNRMCKIYGDCIGCPLSPPGCEAITTKEPEKAIKIVEEWSKEHPIKTNLDALIDLIEEHFGSNYIRHHRIGLDDSIKFSFKDGFLDEEYKGELPERKEDKLSFEEAVRIHKKICDGHTRGKCTIYTKSCSCVSCEGWCFDNPREAQEILLNWKKEQENS